MSPRNLRSGFQATGLAPFNPKAVKPSKTVPSLVFPTSPTSSRQHTTSIIQGETSLCTELRGYFSEVLKPSQQTKLRKRRRIELKCHGEVLTSDEVIEGLEEVDKRKAAEKKRKRKNKKTTAAESDPDDVNCEQCGQAYSEEESDSWIGCDSCESWWHYWCAGLSHMLTEADEWLCEHAMPAIVARLLTLYMDPSTNHHLSFMTWFIPLNPFLSPKPQNFSISWFFNIFFSDRNYPQK